MGPAAAIIRGCCETRPSAILKPPYVLSSCAAGATKAWWVLYRKRSGVERISGRAKDFRRLNRLTPKGVQKATVHCLVSLLTLLAFTLAALLLGFAGDLRACV